MKRLRELQHSPVKPVDAEVVGRPAPLRLESAYRLVTVGVLCLES